MHATIGTLKFALIIVMIGLSGCSEVPKERIRNAIDIYFKTVSEEGARNLSTHTPLIQELWSPGFYDPGSSGAAGSGDGPSDIFVLKDGIRVIEIRKQYDIVDSDSSGRSILGDRYWVKVEERNLGRLTKGVLVRNEKTIYEWITLVPVGNKMLVLYGLTSGYLRVFERDLPTLQKTLKEKGSAL